MLILGIVPWWQGTPRKLVKVNLGNIPHQELTRLLISHLDKLALLDRRGAFLAEVDMNRISVIGMEP